MVNMLESGRLVQSQGQPSPRWSAGDDEWDALVLPGCRVLSWRAGRVRAVMPPAAGVVLTLVAAVVVGTTSCTGAAPHDPAPPVPLAPRTRSPASATSVLTGTADVIADEVAARLFASSPVVVVASPDPSVGLAAARDALRAHAPILLTSAPTGGATASNPFSGTAAPSLSTAAPSSGTAAAVSAMLRVQLRALDPRAVLAVGVAASVLAAQLPGIRVVTDPALLPATKAPAPLDHVALLVHPGDGDAATLAAVTTAQVAGAHVIAVRGNDPRADPAAIAALSAVRPQQVLAIGSGFGPAGRLASRIAVAQTGVQLPGGGQVLFPSHLLVALYGHPYAPALGALGQQDLSASIARAKSVAAAYRSLSHVRVVPAFEIIATVAQAHAGPDGDYSYESPVSSLRPWVRQATAAGIYVIVDLQPGRASLLAQAERYQSLLERPDVGLALDPEWNLAPGQLPLQQIGSVSATEVNSVITWLAGLTARYRLPQKLLVLHQFQLSMIRDEHKLDVRYDDLAIVIHMDGQGTPGDKQQTWAAVTGAAPAGVFFGWKNFYVKDHPMLSPRQTIMRTPRLSMISYE
jgi:hypothetical protein